MVQALFEQGILARNGAVKLMRPLAQAHLPVTVQGLLASRIDRLPAEEKELLQTLAVIGHEFSLALVKQVTQQREEELELGLANLRRGEFVYEQPAAEGVEYSFKHALTQEVAYNSLLSERRRLLHERTGEAMESMFAERLDDYLGQLAHHYSRSVNTGKAVEYLQRAARQATERSLYSEAVARLGEALELLKRLPDDGERTRQELELQLALGWNVNGVKGVGAPEVECAFARARELCEQVGDVAALSRALYGLWVCHNWRGNLRQARELSDQLLAVAERAQSPAVSLAAHHARGVTLTFLGEYPGAREQLEKAVAVFGPDQRLPGTLEFPRTDSAGWLPFALWALGYPDSASTRSREGLALARQSAQPMALAIGLSLASHFSMHVRDGNTTHEYGQELAALSEKHGFPMHSAWALTYSGAVLILQGRAEEGVAELRRSMAALKRSPNAEDAHRLGLPGRRPRNYRAAAGGARGIAGRFDDGRNKRWRGGATRSCLASAASCC